MSNYAASIDFGSSKIAIAVGEKCDAGVRIVSYLDADAVGISNGEIIKERQVVDTINSLIKKAEEEINEKITEVTVSLSGKSIHSKTATCNLLRPNPESYIEEEELSEITRGRYKTEIEEGSAVFEAIPQSYDIDEYMNRSHNDLIGMKGREIDATYCLIYGKASNLSRRTDILDSCNLHMKKAILSPIASARAVLTCQEMENGAALVDIGKGNTEIAIVKDNVVRAVGIIPFAGESITKDIKNVTNITAKWAEEIKMMHGCSCADYTPENKKLVLRGQDGSVDGEIELQLLSEVIEARLSEIFDAVRYVIEQSGYADKLSGGVVITGGTAYMEFIQQLAKALLGQKVRLAAPKNSITSDSCTEAQDAYSSTAVGLVLETLSPMLSHACTNEVRKIPATPKIEPEKTVFPVFDFGQDTQPAAAKVNVESEPEEDIPSWQPRDDERMSREQRREEERRMKAERKQKEKEEKERKAAAKQERKRREEEMRHGKKSEPGLFDKLENLFSPTNDNA